MTFKLNNSNYRPQRSWGKVIFSQASVILLTRGVPGPGGCLVSGGAWSQRVVHSPRGVVHGPRGCVVWGVPGLGGRGVPGGEPPCKTATAVGGTHPTGMHSCFKCLQFFLT